MEEDLPVNLANWPEDWAERGIGETLLAAPELLVMWSRTRLSRPRRPGRVDTLAGLRAHFDLPGRLDEEPRAPPRRRVVVLTPNDVLAAGFPIVAAPVTSQVPPVPTADYVLLPFKNPPDTRHPATGLTRRAGIVCTWLAVVEPQAISGRSGYVSASAIRSDVARARHRPLGPI
jgi:hypothetical protein